MIANEKPACFSASCITNCVAWSMALFGPYQSTITPSIPRLIMSSICRFTCDASFELYPTFMWPSCPNQSRYCASTLVVLPAYRREWMFTLLTLFAPRFPLTWFAKLLEALLLFAV